MPQYASTEMKRGAASACHLQPYTLSDPGGKYLRTGTTPSMVRQLHTSIKLPMKGEVCGSREMCYVPLLFGIAGLTRGVVGGMLPP